MGRRTAEKAKTICPPPSGVDIILTVKHKLLSQNIQCFSIIYNRITVECLAITKKLEWKYICLSVHRGNFEGLGGVMFWVYQGATMLHKFTSRKCSCQVIASLRWLLWSRRSEQAAPHNRQYFCVKYPYMGPGVAQTPSHLTLKGKNKVNRLKVYLKSNIHN